MTMIDYGHHKELMDIDGDWGLIGLIMIGKSHVHWLGRMQLVQPNVTVVAANDNRLDRRYTETLADSDIDVTWRSQCS